VKSIDSVPGSDAGAALASLREKSVPSG